MARPTQVLIIEPQNELKFKGPFNVAVTSYMKLTNPSDKKIMFKIKTTAPKKYCVRPNSGVLEPLGVIEIAISLQPFVFDPAEKTKHKFMVQTIYAPNVDVNLEQYWKETGPEQLMDSKLKCVFEVPVEQNDTEEFIEKSPGKDSVPPNSTSMPVSPELEKAAQMVSQLREEESSLRLENLRLKEEILLLKNSGNRSPQPNRYAPPPSQQQCISPTYIVAAVIMGILGIIFGKFAL